MKTPNIRLKGLLLVLILSACQNSFTQDIPDPESYFGFKPGTDYKMLRWDKIASYYNILGDKSPRIKVVNLGETTLGNPFLLAIISSPKNLSRLEKYKEISKKLAQGKVSEEEAIELAKEGKTIVLITSSMHANEIGPTQMSPELGFSLATSNSPEIEKMLEDVILLYVPSWNPDGNIMETDWYNQNVGTPFEGSTLPRLWHHYVGHDINRDAFMHTQIETRYVNNLLYHDWYPQVFMDMHEYLWKIRDARLVLSPLYEPRHHSIDPLLTREIELTSAHMRTVLEEKGKIGVMHYAKWSEWRISAVHTNSLWHNVVTILFEAATAKKATPVFQKESDLNGLRGGLGHDGNKQSINHPSPWTGGWWRLRDIVEYSYWSCMGLLEASAIHRERLLLNMYRMARNSIEKGENIAPYAFVIPQNQKDPNTVAKMINVLISNGAEIHQATNSFKAADTKYPKGTYVIKLSQAYRPFIIDIMSPQNYPDRRLYPGGTPESTFDVIGWTLPYQMGVDVVEVKDSFTADLSPILKAEPPEGMVRGRGGKYIIDHNVLDSYKAVNRLLKEGHSIGWAAKSFASGRKQYPKGTIIATGQGIDDVIGNVSKEFNLEIDAGNPTVELMKLKPLKLGLYQSWTANMDEGWTRWIFEQWGFPYKTLHNKDIQSDNLKSDYDVIVVTNMGYQSIVNGHERGIVPEEYTGGIAEAGLDALKNFVNEGGTLITLNSSVQLPIALFNLPLRNITRDYPSTEFYLPSAILKVELDNDHPITFGMNSNADILSFNSPVLDFSNIKELSKHEDYYKDYLPFSNLKVVAGFPDDNPFRSGRLIGEQILRKKPVLIEADYGEGKIIMFAFRPQNRAQTHGTFMLFFNSLYYGQAAMDN
jgi:hypothetical protein|tara:strand:- start:3935 stop:6559 length:2625 start_codon:yes stop_codon:yes gene_type:complete